MSCESKTNPYGMIIVASDKHRTAVVVKGNNVVILESLGTSTHVGKNSISQISLAIKNIPGQEYNIFAPAQVRQADSVSCGTDAFVTLKEALRIEDLFTFIEGQKTKPLTLSSDNITDPIEQNDPFYRETNITIKEFPFLPEEIVKYSQAFSKISKLKSSSRNTRIKINSPFKRAATSLTEEGEIESTEKLLEYAERHKETQLIPKKVINSPSTDSESTFSMPGSSRSQTLSPFSERSMTFSPDTYKAHLL